MTRKIKLLIVEDEAMTAMLLRRGFQLIGYEVAEPVSTGELAIQRAASEQPDVVLMDIRLTGSIDGVEAAKEIIHRYALPVIFMTGYSDANMTARIKALNALHLIKPLTPAQLHPAIQKVLHAD